MREAKQVFHEVYLMQSYYLDVKIKAMLQGAIIGAFVGLIFYLVKQAKEKKQQQGSDLLDDSANTKQEENQN